MDFELEIIRWFQRFSSGFTDFLGEAITMLGEQLIVVVIIAFIYFVYNKKAGEYIAYSVFFSASLNGVVKGLVKAERPFQIDDSIVGGRQETATGFSFPSGHTQNAATFYTAIAKVFKNKKIWITAGIIIVLVGISRIYLGVHFPRDVIAGIILGVAAAFFSAFLYKKVDDDFKKKAILFAITALIFIPFLIIFYEKDYAKYEDYKDLYMVFSLYLGFALAILIENKFVNFDCNISLKKRLIRFAGALVIFIGLYIILSFLFDLINDQSILLDMLRYFLLSFSALGIYPLFFKKLKLI